MENKIVENVNDFVQHSTEEKKNQKETERKKYSQENNVNLY